ncbi:MAG: hypothetical protein E7292_11180 [Lachnospiraceae bacterium]|nr:hypothetical protein [Lachnospiraceae bacterium]
MIDKRGEKRILAMLLTFVLLVSTLYVDALGSVAAELYHTDSFDGTDLGYEAEIQYNALVESADAGSNDGSDVGSNDGNDVSGSDISGNNQPLQEEAFLVKDSKGEVFGAYDNWDALVADFAVKGKVSKEYIISVLPSAVIGKTMPSQTAGLTLTAADKRQSVLNFAAATFNMTTPLVVDAGTLCVADTESAVNINTKGKQLTLIGVQKLGTLKGTSKGSLVVKGNVALQGHLQTFRNLTVAGTLQVGGNVSGITNLVMEKGTVYLTPGKKFTVTNVNTVAGGVLGFPTDGTTPVVKINGNVSGVLALKQFVQTKGNYVEREFAAGSKLLTASKATAEQFSLAGDKQVCYKKGSVFYVGAEVLELYKGEKHLGTYAQWNDLKTKINNLKDKTAGYRVVLLEDYVVNGALSMPAKGRYASLLLQNGKGSPVSLKATGNLSLTANLMLEPGIALEAKQISGAAWNLNLGDNGSVVATGNLTVKNLTLGKGAQVKAGGKLTVKSVLEAVGENELTLTYKKAAAIKDTIATDKINIKLVDKSGRRVKALTNTTVMSVTGSSYATQYCLLDDKDSELALYRKGSAIKVKGTVATPITLCYRDGEEKVSLGDYATLTDVKNEIARRKIGKGEYEVHVGEQVFVKGAFPLPKTGTYKSITFTGEKIRITGAMALTGDITVSNEIERIKSEQDVTSLPLTVKLSKYTLSLSQRGIKNLSIVTGVAGSGLTIGEGVQQNIEGNLKADALTLAGALQVKGDIAVIDIYPQAGNRLDYDLTRNITIKGSVYGAKNKLLLNPLRNGKSISYVEDMKVLPDAPKVVVSGLKLVQETEWVLYRESGAVRLGKALLTVFENTSDYSAVQGAEIKDNQRFARVSDAVEYVNALEGTDYVIRLDANISSTDSLKTPAKSKNVVICGATGERKELKFTGNIVVDEGSLHIRDIVLDNGKANGPGVILINGAQIHLCDVNVNTITAPAKTSVTLEGEVDINGSIAGACDMTLKENAVIRADNTITINSMTLHGASKGTAQLRLQVDKKMTINNAVSTPEEGQFIINRVDKNNELAELSKGTVMLTASCAQASQFKTNNIMPGTFREWFLIKNGSDIQTAEATQGDGEWSGDFL